MTEENSEEKKRFEPSPGIGKYCNICDKEFTEDDVAEDKINTIINIPGQCHNRCKAEHDINTVSSGKISNLSSEQQRLLGD